MQALHRIRRVRALVLTLAAAGGALSAPTVAAAQTTPLSSDPVGPISNVTADWQYYQPASDFCVADQVVEVPSDTQDTQTGSNPACAFSGFAPADTGLYEVKIVTPPLCATCVRLFIDYAAIQPSSIGTYSQGHAFYRPSSANPTYSSPPTAHSPNIKNFTNDYLVSPPGSTQSQVFSNVDPHLLTYAADTAHFAHTTVQGPYYIGPWYVNQYGDRIDGAYIDVDLSQATQLGQAELDDIYYGAAYNTDPSLCPDTLADPAYNDANYLYGGCVNAFGISSEGIDPWPGG